MKSKPILIVPGEPKSIFFEIFFKSIKRKKFKSPLIIITSVRLLKSEMKKNNFRKKINLIEASKINHISLNNFSLNVINVEKKPKLDNKYITDCFNAAFDLIKSGFTNKLINGPINKEKFLKKKFLGITEYISRKFNTKKTAMLIFNKKLSVCPATTHIPIKFVSKKIKKETIKEKIVQIDKFFKKYLNLKPKIAITGLNPHCESISDFNEDQKILKPLIKLLKKRSNLKIFGPYASDTIFLKKNRKRFNVILGMYHDQVLTPIKTLYEYDAINITIGLPFLRVSPDHGPNEKMIGKKLSNPLSLIRSIEFLDKK